MDILKATCLNQHQMYDIRSGNLKKTVQTVDIVK